MITLQQIDMYSGVWYEQASMKRGFNAEGQMDCIGTRGVYKQISKDAPVLEADTKCRHGSQTAPLTGIKGRVDCSTTPCKLTFPILPWIRAEYNILKTDFKRFSIVSAGPDFIQVYSRKPCLNPRERMALKEMVKDFGYDPNELKDTPTECDTDPVDVMIQDAVDVLNI